MARIDVISTGTSTRSSDELRAIALAQFRANFAFEAVAEFYSITGNADNPRRSDDDMTAGANRVIGGDYTPKANTPAFGAVALKIYGDKVQTDVAHERRGQDIGSQRLRDLENFSRSLGRKLSDAIVNGDNAVNVAQTNGLKKLATEIGTVTTYGGTNGGVLPTGATDTGLDAALKFMEVLEAEIAMVPGGAQFIACNAQFIARLKSLARSRVTTTTITNALGAPVRITEFDGIPLINAGYKSDGQGLVIPNNETVGTSQNCTSLYIGRYGEEQDITIATNVGLDVYDVGLVGAAYQTMVEMDLDQTLLNPKSLRRVQGVRFSE
jgi:hypothetical protein